MSTPYWIEDAKPLEPRPRGDVAYAARHQHGTILRGTPHFPLPAALVAASLAYYLLARLGVAIGIPPDGIAVFWPPNAIILCTFLIVARARWSAFVPGFLVAEVAGDVPAFTIGEAIGFGVVNCFEGMLSALILRRLFGAEFRLSSPRELLHFILVAIVGVPAVAALGGAAIYVLGGSNESYSVLWRVWWVGDAVGLVALAPFILTLWWRFRDGFGALRTAYWLELGLALSVLAVVTAVAFQLDRPVATDHYRIFYIYPVLVWIAARGRVLGAAAAGTLIASMVSWLAVSGAIPVADGRFDEVFFLQQFLAVTILSTLTLAVLVQETAVLNRKLGVELERTRLEKEILEAKERAERANEAKTTFLAHLSHELRTPLNAIIGFAGIIRNEEDGPLDNGRYREHAAVIEDSGQHLLSLINELIDATRIEQGILELSDDVVRPGDAIDRVFRMLRSSASRKNIRLNNPRPTDLPTLRCDEVRLRQVLINVIGNALKFSPANSQVDAFAALDSGALKFVVRDHGPGIPADKISAVFGRFEQFSSDPHIRAQGLGLGLYVSRMLMEAHGGTISIESVMEKGTTVTIEFPPDRVVPA